MGELTISNLIKIILGILVVAAVVYGVYSVFKGNLIDFFNNWGGETVKNFLVLIK